LGISNRSALRERRTSTVDRGWPHLGRGSPYTLTLGVIRSTNDQRVHLDSETETAIDQALEAANLLAGGSTATSAAFVVEDREQSAAEDGSFGAADGD
jgi:hypothetical protein